MEQISPFVSSRDSEVVSEPAESARQCGVSFVGDFKSQRFMDLAVNFIILQLLLCFFFRAAAGQSAMTPNT
jgi:hypothetical protein